MTIFRAIAVIAGLTLVTWLVPWRTFGAGLAPDLVLPAIIILATRIPRDKAVMLGAFAGLLQDALSTAPFGVRALAMAVTVYVVTGLMNSVHIETFHVRVVLLFAASAMATVLESALWRWSLAVPASTQMDGLAGRAALTAGVGLMLWYILPSGEKRAAW